MILVCIHCHCETDKKRKTCSKCHSSCLIPISDLTIQFKYGPWTVLIGFVFLLLCDMYKRSAHWIVTCITIGVILLCFIYDLYAKRKHVSKLRLQFISEMSNTTTNYQPKLTFPYYTSSFIANAFGHYGKPTIKKRKSLSSPMRQQVWEKTYGNQFQTICVICKRNQINAFQFHCGHIISVQQGGSDTLDNLVAICAQCNLSMGTEHLDDFQKRMHQFQT